MAQVIESGMERVSFWWCRLLHDACLWPIHGRYECRTCGRRHLVGW